MRLLYVVSDPGVPLRGTKGASVHVRELGRALSRLGHEVDWAVASADGPEAAPPGRVVAAPRPEGDEQAPRAQRAAGAVESAYAATRLERPDAVYERLSLFGGAGASIARSLGVPLLLEVNAPLVDEARRHRGLSAARRARAFERALLRSADRVVAVSERLRDWLVADGVDARRVTVLPNGVHAARFARRPGDRRAARHALGLGGEATVGFVGTLKPWHDVAGLVDGVAALARSGRRATLVVIGDGPERPALESLARQRGVDARFAGAVTHPQVARLLPALDVGAVPYRTPDVYFSPLKLFEYLAAGVPVVAADAGDARCCVAPGRGGALYRPGDGEALAGALESLLAAPPEARRALAAAGRRHVVGRHTWDGNARTVVRLAEAAVADRAPRAA